MKFQTSQRDYTVQEKSGSTDAEVPSVVHGMFKYIHVIQHVKLVSNLRDMKEQM
jgi:hypothetical protein